MRFRVLETGHGARWVGSLEVGGGRSAVASSVALGGFELVLQKIGDGEEKREMWRESERGRDVLEVL